MEKQIKLVVKVDTGEQFETKAVSFEHYDEFVDMLKRVNDLEYFTIDDVSGNKVFMPSGMIQRSTFTIVTIE